MKLLVEVHGHQTYREHQGEALSFGQTAEMFDDKWLQVPCVTLATEHDVLVIPLKTSLTWTKIKRLD